KVKLYYFSSIRPRLQRSSPQLQFVSEESNFGSKLAPTMSKQNPTNESQLQMNSQKYPTCLHNNDNNNSGTVQQTQITSNSPEIHFSHDQRVVTFGTKPNTTNTTSNLSVVPSSEDDEWDSETEDLNIVAAEINKSQQLTPGSSNKLTNPLKPITSYYKSNHSINNSSMQQKHNSPQGSYFDCFIDDEDIFSVSSINGGLAEDNSLSLAQELSPRHSVRVSRSLDPSVAAAHAEMAALGPRPTTRVGGVSRQPTTAKHTSIGSPELSNTMVTSLWGTNSKGISKKKFIFLSKLHKYVCPNRRLCVEIQFVHGTTQHQNHSTVFKTMKETVGSRRKLCIINKRLDGKMAIVTGCNTGIGLYTASELARRGATIIMACRNIERANKAKTRLLEMYGKDNRESEQIDVACSQVKSFLKPIESDQVLETMCLRKVLINFFFHNISISFQLIIEQLDLASLTSIREFVDRIKIKYNKIDFLINNAGLILQNYTTTEDGFEMTMGVNYFGPFLLTELLLPLLKNAAPSRIINVSSALHKDGRILKPDLQYSKENYNAMKAYSVSKLANVIHTIELNERLKDSGVVAVCLHPGAVKTELMRDLTNFPMVRYSNTFTYHLMMFDPVQ
ncbi:unnamed protein product, partial [Schistosoma margrebowiei]